MRDLSGEEEIVVMHLGRAYMAFSNLAPAHPYDIGDFVTAIHAAQNIVLARPATELLTRDLHDSELDEDSACV